MRIKFNQVSYTYAQGTPFAYQALKDVTFEIPDGSYTAIIGHTGSGKSTITQHLNGLLIPSQGRVEIGDQVLTNQSQVKDGKQIRSQVGIVFQFPESQLFEETVLKDVMFAPLNFGKSTEEAEDLAIKALDMVGLSADFYDRSPFDLSGGQMRRVAIAGILAMQPKVLVLDEPTAGLDPKGRRDMMTMFADLHVQAGITLVLVTHQMNDVADYANHVIVMDHGQCVKSGEMREVFADPEWLTSLQLGLPDSLSFYQSLQACRGGKLTWDQPPLTIDDLLAEISKNYQAQGGNQHD
ncbi:energy-coupling factor transporter ATPase [Aerococcus urinaehominis]|uniref:Energy-coupling factor transporter ATP-binding protein EcfA2 n=1 Tax=Aerococcus urinaehominis TaxID=128944 RepID=A0A0X8FMJ2_9LACT|nr:energy-coupling factor transporter ATPase [Aerococcus urinaehominis]AMC00036.1 energy-coupling factor transporter ATPase [Aerococcus urinaehominis]